MRAAPVFLATVLGLAAMQVPVLADCQCLANGRKFEQGQVTCLKLPTGAQVARCDKVLNNSSWKKLQDGCPSSAIPKTREMIRQVVAGSNDLHGSEVRVIWNQ